MVSPQDKRGKKAILQYETLAQENEKSLLIIHLLTGRHHQIRAQLSFAGCPIIGDRKYGSKEKSISFPALWCLSMKVQKEDGSTILATAFPDAEVFFTVFLSVRAVEILRRQVYFWRLSIKAWLFSSGVL